MRSELPGGWGVFQAFLWPCVVQHSAWVCQNLDGAGGKLDADGGLGLDIELVSGKSGQKIRLPYPRVPDQHHLEEVVVLVILGHGWEAEA